MRGGSHIVVNLLAAPMIAYGITQVCNTGGHPVIAVSIVAISVILSCKLPDQVEVLKFLGHRTWSHSLVLPIILIGIFAVIDVHWSVRFALVGLCAGYLTHLLADLCSLSGVPLLIGGFRLRIPLYTTGKTSELIVLVIIGSLLIFSNLQIPQIKSAIKRIQNEFHPVSPQASPNQVKLQTNGISR